MTTPSSPTSSALFSLDSLLTTQQCADLAGCKPATFREMVSRRKAPPPIAGIRSEDGQRLFDAHVFLSWLAARPGPGNRETGRRRSSPQTRTRSWSQGNHPAYRPSPHKVSS